MTMRAMINTKVSKYKIIIRVIILNVVSVEFIRNVL